MTMAQLILVDAVRTALKVASKTTLKRRWPLTNDELDELAYSVLVVTERNFRNALIACHQNVDPDAELQLDLPLAGGC